MILQRKTGLSENDLMLNFDRAQIAIWLSNNDIEGGHIKLEQMNVTFFR